jgi:hypothetical protein
MDSNLTRREIANRLSGYRTQLKRNAGGAREAELRRYIAQLVEARDRLPLEERLAELDGRWNRLVDEVAAALDLGPERNRRIQAHRNGQARKRARRGLGPLESIKAEIRRNAEDEILRRINAHADEAWARRALAEIDEAYDLRAELDRRAGFDGI